MRALAYLAALPVLASSVPNPYRMAIPVIAKAPSMARDTDLSTWAGAQVVTDFSMSMPDDKGENRWPTQVHLAWGPDALYIAAECFDPEPHLVRAKRHQRDDFSGDLDFFGVDVDPSGKGQSSLRLLVTPLGGQFDAIVTDSAGENYTYDCLWDSVGLRTPQGYLVKLRIPYSSLRRVPGEWGLRFLRIVPRERRYGVIWPRFSRDIQCDLCQMAKVSGAPVTQPGSPFMVIPFGTYSREQLLDRDPAAPAESTRRLGMDLRYAGTAFTLEGTYRPDFATADADVDPLQINSRFKVFYPERRPFFLEGMELLGIQGAQRQFFSRSVLSPLYGLKGSGQTGRTGWTLLQARDQEGGRLLGALGAEGTEGQATRDTAAAVRLQLDGQGSGLSVLGTEKRLLGGSSDQGGQSGGVYWDQYLGSEFHVAGSAISANARLPQADGSSRSDRGSALSGRLDWNTRNWSASALHQATGPDFILASGFTDLRGYRRNSGNLSWRERWNQGALAQAAITLRSRRFDWWNGDPMERTSGLDAYLESAGRLSLSVSWDVAGRIWSEDRSRSAASRMLDLTLRWQRHSWAQAWVGGAQGRTLDLGSGEPARLRSLSFGSEGSVRDLSYSFSAQSTMLDRESDNLRLIRARALVASTLWQLPAAFYVKTQGFAIRYDGAETQGVDKFLKVFVGWRPDAFTQAYLGWSGQRRWDPSRRIDPERMVERGIFAKVAWAYQF